MATGSLLALLDDISTVLDDVAVLTKLAARKSAGVLGDDLALNAQQVTGVQVHRELPVVWAVMKGSFRNKAILVPLALAISAFAPWLVTPLLMMGGAFLCYEGFEKVAHSLSPTAHQSAETEVLQQALRNPEVDLVALEQDKIKGAIRTDFILSAEIIAITLGTVAEADLTSRILVLVGIALLMTVGVYGLVAGVVKLDDAGLHLSRREGRGALDRALRGLGHGILLAAPYLMRTLSIVGTAAMFLVGGGILAHGVPMIQRAIEGAAEGAGHVVALGGLLEAVTPSFFNGLVGVAAGAIAFGAVALFKRMRRGSAATA